MNNIPQWVNNYIGIPYKRLTNSMEEADCLGIIQLIYKSQFNVELPDYVRADVNQKELASIVIKEKLEEWVKIKQPEPNCMILFNIMGYPIHMGMVLNDKYMIHSLEGHNSAIERYDGIKWNNRIEGFYKWPFM